MKNLQGWAFLLLQQLSRSSALLGLCGSWRTCFFFFADEHRLHSGKLCLIILTCIAEVGFLCETVQQMVCYRALSTCTSPPSC